MATDMTPALIAAARAAGWVFTRQDALAAGYTPAAIRNLVGTGRWRRLRRGAYVEAWRYQRGDERQRHGFEVAAALVTLRERGAAGSHESAARLHGIDLLRTPDVVAITRPPEAPRRAPGRVRVHYASLPGEHLTAVLGVRVTSAARTVVDLARALPFADAVVAADAALHRRRTGQAELERVLARCRGWPGSNQAARVLAFADPGAESPLETLARIMFAEHGLPPPVSQARFRDREGSMRVDFHWPQYATVVECDGMVKYGGADPRPLAEEKRRQERLEALGLTVVRLLWEHVTRRPEASVGRILQAFAREAPWQPQGM